MAEVGFDSDSRYCDKSLAELKKYLRERGLKVSGKKKALVERLLFDDRTSQKDEPLPEFNMALPDAQKFKDIHADHLQNVPKITRQRIIDFLSSCETSFDKKVELLYGQRYLRHVRYTQDGSLTFFTGVIWAEMKKTTSYKVDLCLDANGVVEQTQCECAVGQGPAAHCKHVVCVLHALSQFCDTGKLVTELTCTQVLQTFHKPRPHRGSPLKARSLGQTRGRSRPVLYDPRPVHKRDSAKSEALLRDVILNRQGPSKWPVLQKFSPANIKALALDHQYMTHSLEDHFLREEKVSESTKEEVDEIERSTRGQNATPNWYRERQKRITASNFGTVCKMTDRRNITDLLSSLLGNVKMTSIPTRHGIKYERVAVEKFEALTGLKTKECGLFVAQSHPMLAASPDRIIDNDVLVEVKCPYSARNRPIDESSVPYLTYSQSDGKLTLKNTHNYYYQVQGQLFCAERQVCKLVVYTFKDVKVIDVPIDSLFVENMLVELKKFYCDIFKKAVLRKFLYKGTDTLDYKEQIY